MNKEYIISELKTAIQVALFKKPDMHHVAGDKSRTKMALLILIASFVIVLVGIQLFSPFFKPSIGFAIGMLIFQLISVIIGIYAISFTATKLFKGHGRPDALFRVIGYASIVMAISIFPPLSFISMIWLLVLSVIITKEVNKISISAAIGSLLIGTIAIAILVQFILAPVFAIFGMNVIMKGDYNFGGFGNNNGNIKVMDENNFEMNILGKDAGGLKMENGKMTITGPDGEVMQVSIPQ